MIHKFKYFVLSLIYFYAFFLITPLQSQVIYERHDDPFLRITSGPKVNTVEGRPKVALVMSGGGARGIAHVGVLKHFEKTGIPIDMIVGTSVGSVVGGFYAAGYSAAELEALVRQVDWPGLFQDDTERLDLFVGQKKEQDRYLVQLRFDGLRYFIPTSLTPGQKILSVLSEKLLDANFQALYDFDRLKIPFRAVATDLITGERIVMSHGDLAEAINASIAVPLLFSPVPLENKLLVDGGLRSNIPVDVAKDLGMDIIIAIDIASPLRKKSELQAPWEIADQVTTIMMSPMREEQLENADFVIQPRLSGIGSSDFSMIDIMIAEGERAADSLSNQILAAIHKKSKPTVNGMFFIKKIEFAPSDVKLNTLEKNGLQAGEYRKVSLAEIQNDVDFLYSRGRFSDVAAKLISNSRDTVLCYQFQSNPQLDAIELKGNSVFADSVLFRMITHPMSLTLNYRRILNDLKSIQEFYRSNGYALMRYDSIQYDSTKQQICLAIDEGKIDSIRIEGNLRTEPYIINREFPITANEMFNSIQVRKGIENIYNTQLFDKVNVTLQSDNGYRELLIKVQEKKYTVLHLGGKLDLERGGQAYVEFGDVNFMGRGNILSLISQIGTEVLNTGINFRVDRIFSSYLTFSMNGYYSSKINPYYQEARRLGKYKEIRRGVRIVFGQQMRKLGQLTAELRIENAKDFRHSGEFAAVQNSELRTLAFRSVTDKRDKIGFTNNGTYNIWFWETGNERIFEGQEKFTKAFVNLEAYYTYWARHTFHVRIRTGLADRTLPFSEYFRLGGLNDFFGLHEDEFYGRQMFVTNLEYRYQFPFKVINDTFLGFRYDIGAVWENPNLVIKNSDFFYGAGAWFGIDTLLGPLQLGYGRTKDSRDVFYFSLGYDF